MHRTRAPFFVNHAWQWHTWTNSHASKYAAIHEKAAELRADRWDYGQTDHEEASRASF